MLTILNRRAEGDSILIIGKDHYSDLSAVCSLPAHVLLNDIALIIKT